MYIIVLAILFSPIIISLVYSGIYSNTFRTHILYGIFHGSAAFLLYDEYIVDMHEVFSDLVFTGVSIGYGIMIVLIIFMVHISQRPIDRIKRQGTVSIQENPSEEYFDAASVGETKQTDESFIIEYHKKQEKWTRSFSSLGEFGQVLSKTDTNQGVCTQCETVSSPIIEGIVIKEGATNSNVIDSRRETLGVTVEYMCADCFKEISTNLINDSGNKLTEDTIVAHTI